MEREKVKAFPSKEVDYDQSHLQERTVYYSQEEGMDLRDYFAGKAIEGFANKIWNQGSSQAEYLATNAYELADAMMRQREIPKK